MSVQESALPRQGIEGLYAEHHGWLRGWLRGRLGNAFDAADLAHDTYLRILSSGRMPEPQQSRQHLAQIAKGLVIDLYRRRQIEAAYLDALARLPQPLAPSAEDCAAAVQALVDIDAVLNGLPPKAREALLLRKLDGMSYRDIATRLRVSVSSVESTWRPPCWPAARPGWRCPRLARHAILPHRSRHRPARRRMDGPPVVGRRQRAGPRRLRALAGAASRSRTGLADPVGVRGQAGGRAAAGGRSCLAARRIRHGTAPRHAPAGAGRAAGGLRLRPAWHRRLAWRHRRLPQRHRGNPRADATDGTRLTLSTGTAIDLRFDANARLVLLLAGEILVATAPDPAATPRPFRVRGRHGTVQALGTRFTVREDDEDARVAVFEGAVEIRPAGAPDAAIRLDAGQGSRFPLPGRPAHPGQRGRGILEPRRAGGRRLAAGRLPGRAGPLPARPAALRPAVADLRVSGVFPLHDTDRALHNLERGLPVAVVYRTRYWVTVRAAD